MGIPRSLRSPALAVAALAALAAAPLTALPASAATLPDRVSLSTEAQPTVQVNGVVWSQTIVDNTVYAVGEFTTAKPIAGGKVTRKNVLAYDLTTGELDADFVANTNGQVNGVSASPDGSVLYLGGNFTKVNGTKRSYLAAVKPATGNLTSFHPKLNAQVSAIAAGAKGVWTVGNFTRANSTTVHRAAAFTTAGKTTKWHPKVVGGLPRALTVNSAGTIAVVGGDFTEVNGVHAGGWSATNAANGKHKSWKLGRLLSIGGENTGVYSLSSDADSIYLTAFSYSADKPEQSFEGVMSVSWKGGVRWMEDCHGDSYGAAPMNGLVYVASHSHFCGNVPEGFGEMDANTGHRATAFTNRAVARLDHNHKQKPGWYSDFGGEPAPLLEKFFPTLSVGSYTGQDQAAWSVAAKDDVVVYGGEFTKVNGEKQTGLVRFSEPTVVTTPVDDTLTARYSPDKVAKPNTVALGPTKVAVKWKAASDAEKNAVNKYRVRLYRGSKVVKTKTVSAKADALTAVFTGLEKKTTYKAAVTPHNVIGYGKQSAKDSAKTKSKGKNLSSTAKPKVAKPTATGGAGKVAVHWTKATVKNGLAVSGYQVQVLLDGKVVKTASAADTKRSIKVSDLERATAYTVQVRAKNWGGWGKWSSEVNVTTT